MLGLEMVLLLLVLCALVVSADEFVVLTPNRGYTGVMGRLAFRDGVALTSDAGVARDLAANYNYVVMRKADLVKLADDLNPKPESPPDAESEPPPDAEAEPPPEAESAEGKKPRAKRS